MAGLRDRRVADIMDHDCPTVEGHLTLQDFVDDYVFRTGRRCFVVVQNGRVAGLITPHEVRTVDRAAWSQTSVQSVMRPLGQLRTVTPDTPAIQALELMSRGDINQLPVDLRRPPRGSLLSWSCPPLPENSGRTTPHLN